MRKPIYRPEKLYVEDINDLVEADLEKGGPGSGKKGHKTVNVHGSHDSFHRPRPQYNSDVSKEYKETDRRSPGKKITDGMHYSERKKYEEKK